jgi:hypothetical protein
MQRILVLVGLAFLVAACGGPPAPTPDVVATEVAEGLAVAATLTAFVPTATPTPTPLPGPTETVVGSYMEDGTGGFSHRWVAYEIRPEEGAADQSLFVELNGQRLGPYTNLSGLFAISADGEHIAFAAEKDGAWHIVVDGEDRWEHPALGWATYTWSSDLEGRSVTMQSQAVILALSATGDQVAYLSQEGDGQWAMCVNGQCSPHEDVGSDVHFVDGKPAYWAQDAAGQIFVYGDQTLGPYDELWRTRTSSDGKHWVVVAKRQGSFLLLIDGREQSVPGEVVAYEIGPGGEVAYAFKADGKVKVVFDGQELPGEVDAVEYPAISPDGKHVAFWARSGSAWSVVTDREAYPGFGGYYFYDIGGEYYSILWDKSSENLAYVARGVGEGVVFALNGKQQPDVAISGFTPSMYVDDEGNNVGVQCLGCPPINPPGFVECLLRRGESNCDPTEAVIAGGELAYIEAGDTESFLVIGARKEGPYPGIEGPLLTSADGHYAYVVDTDLGQQMVVDGNLMDLAYEAIYRPRFVEGRGLAHLGKRGDSLVSVFYPFP